MIRDVGLCGHDTLSSLGGECNGRIHECGVTSGDKDMIMTPSV